MLEALNEMQEYIQGNKLEINYQKNIFNDICEAKS